MWNRQPTREVITKESIRAELMKSANGGVPLAAMTVVAAILFGGIFVALGFASLPSKAQLAGDTFPFLNLSLAIMFFLMSILGMGFAVYMLVSVVAESKYLREGCFTVEEDELVNMIRETQSLRIDYSSHGIGSRQTQYRDVFYFQKSGRYVLSRIDGSAFEYSSIGDTFYVVLMDPRRKIGKQIRPKRVYNSKIYRYEERP